MLLADPEVGEVSPLRPEGDPKTVTLYVVEASPRLLMPTVNVVELPAVKDELAMTEDVVRLAGDSTVNPVCVELDKVYPVPLSLAETAAVIILE